MQKDLIELLKMIRSAIITSKNKVNQAVKKNS